MPSIEEHKKSAKQFEEDIIEKVNKELTVERQKIIGFSTMEGAKNYFEILLHEKKLITEGTNINHRWFASLRITSKRFPFDFPHKKELLEKLIALEGLRGYLCYGKEKPRKEVERAIRLFFEIKEIIVKEVGGI